MNDDNDHIIHSNDDDNNSDEDDTQGQKKYGSLVAGLPANFKSHSQSWLGQYWNKAAKLRLGQRPSQPFYPHEQLPTAKNL